MARVSTKIGDVFSVKINESSKKYFQLIAFDLTQLNSDVIRAFRAEYTLEENPDINKIVNNEVDFHAHCSTKAGVKLGFWEKIGSTKEIGSLKHILFRDTNDYGTKPGEKPIEISENWFVWQINDDFKRVGKLRGKYQKAEIGLVFSPIRIVSRIKTGDYGLINYPGY